MTAFGLGFGERVALVLAFLTLVSAIEIAVRRGAARRWRLSLFLVGCGVVGAAAGVAIDTVTCRISPFYFAAGKMLGGGPGLCDRARLLGLEAGTSVGVYVACIYLVADGPVQRVRVLVTQARGPLLWAAALGLVGGGSAAVGLLPAPSVHASYGLSSTEVDAFSIVWGIHTGVYSGVLIGALRGAYRIRRTRAGGRASSSSGGSR